MLNSVIVKELYYSKYFNGDEFSKKKDHSQAKIDAGKIDWESITDIITKDRSIITILGDSEMNKYEMGKFAKLLEEAGNHICFYPIDWWRVNHHMKYLFEYINNYDKEHRGTSDDPEDAPMYHIRECADELKDDIEDIREFMDESLLDKSDIIIVFNTQQDSTKKCEELLAEIDLENKEVYYLIKEGK